MNLSKTKYCKGLQCPKMLWLEENYPNEAKEVNNSSTLDNGTEVGILAKQLFGNYTDISFNQELNKMLNDTKNALENDKIIITEASFLYKNNFCSIDILKKDGNKYEIYEVKSSTKVKDIFIDDASYQYFILSNLGYNIENIFIVYINNKYERIGELELNKLFNIQNITNEVVNKQDSVKETILKINNYLENPYNIDISINCTCPYDCPFFEYCTKELPQNNIFKLRGIQSKTKFKLYSERVYSFEDLQNIKINEKCKQQIEFELTNTKDYINKPKIKEFLNTLTYPLYYLDFETFQQSIPKFNHIKPYSQVPFQYSLHIEDKKGNIEHKEFLAEANIDPRRCLAENLVKDIPKNVCILAYNMRFEKMVIKELARIYPDLSEHLMNIHDNMKDLMIPFVNRDYYTKAMQGSFSIKYVLPALFPEDESLNYHSLEQVHNGSEAMSAYAKLDKLSYEDEQILRQNLLKYCELDTYAMVKICKKLKEVVDE